jgi:hypothetical protein
MNQYRRHRPIHGGAEVVGTARLMAVPTTSVPAKRGSWKNGPASPTNRSAPLPTSRRRRRGCMISIPTPWTVKSCNTGQALDLWVRQAGVLSARAQESLFVSHDSSGGGWCQRCWSCQPSWGDDDPSPSWPGKSTAGSCNPSRDDDDKSAEPRAVTPVVAIPPGMMTTGAILLLIGGLVTLLSLQG